MAINEVFTHEQQVNKCHIEDFSSEQARNEALVP